MSICVVGCAPSPHDIAASGDIDRLRSMLEANAKLVSARNGMEKTPLHFAVTYGREDAVALLLEEGADPNAKDVTEMTPLHCAATLDRIDEAKLLHKANADIEAKDAFGDTPLHSAAIYGRVKMIEWLHEQGADMTALNAEEKSPFDLARREHQDNAAKLLKALTSR